MFAIRPVHALLAAAAAHVIGQVVHVLADVAGGGPPGELLPFAIAAAALPAAAVSAAGLPRSVRLPHGLLVGVLATASLLLYGFHGLATAIQWAVLLVAAALGALIAPQRPSHAAPGGTGAGDSA